MEVHHHAHTIDPDDSVPAGKQGRQRRKKWSHYFWEFLMLFLAVFCGFMAENQREHMIEHQREKKYMLAMVRDLKADTASFNIDLPFKKERIAAIDSLFDYFYAHTDNKKVIPAWVHNLLRRSTWDRNYNRNNTTMTQLRNSGNMRLIRKKNVADSILAYDFLWEKADNSYKVQQGINSDLINEYIRKLLNDYSLLPYYRANNTAGAILPRDSTITVSIKTEHLLELLNHLHKVKTSVRNQMDFYRGINEMGARLAGLIEREYE